MRRLCRGHDRGEDRNWTCCGHASLFLVLSGAARAFDMHSYKSRRSALTADEAARWEVRYQIGAMIYAVALGAWCIGRSARQRRCRRPHDLPDRHHRVRGGRCGPHLWTAVDLPRADCCSPAVRLRWRWRFVAPPITSAWRSLSVLFFLGAEAASRPTCSGFSFEALSCARARGGAGRSVRYRAEQHAAWPVHVSAPTAGLR